MKGKSGNNVLRPVYGFVTKDVTGVGFEKLSTLIGATVGRGNGQIMATGAGAAIGAVVGSKIGDSMETKK